MAAAVDGTIPRGAGRRTAFGWRQLLLWHADKLDTLAGIFAIGQKPSGTKDPFGLRRAAIGALRIVTEKKLAIDLRALVTRACALQPVQNAGAAGELWEYMIERLRAYFLDSESAGGVAGVTTEMFDAVRASSPVSPPDFAARLAALAKFPTLAEATSLTAANKRISNILKKADAGTAGAVDVAALREPAEKALHEALAGIVVEVERALARRDYSEALARLATLRPAVDGFFDNVAVSRGPWYCAAIAWHYWRSGCAPLRESRTFLPARMMSLG